MPFTEAFLLLSPLDQFLLLLSILVELRLAGGICRIFQHVFFVEIVHVVSQAVVFPLTTSFFAGSIVLLSFRRKKMLTSSATLSTASLRVLLVSFGWNIFARHMLTISANCFANLVRPMGLALDSFLLLEGVLMHTFSIVVV